VPLATSEGLVVNPCSNSMVHDTDGSVNCRERLGELCQTCREGVSRGDIEARRPHTICAVIVPPKGRGPYAVRRGEIERNGHA
jgi:hypothetical protein